MVNGTIHSVLYQRILRKAPPAISSHPHVRAIVSVHLKMTVAREDNIATTCNLS